jgi:hypothetical protein
MQGDLALKHANGMSFADVLAMHAHMLAEQIRSDLHMPDDAVDEFDAGALASADHIDPEVSTG